MHVGFAFCMCIRVDKPCIRVDKLCNVGNADADCVEIRDAWVKYISVTFLLHDS